MASKYKPAVGLVRADGRVVMEGGELSSVKAQSLGTALYAVRRLHDPDGEIYWKNDRTTAFLDGRTIRYLHQTFRDRHVLPNTAQVVEGLMLWRDWLWSHGVSVAQGPSRIADQLWHKTSRARTLPEITSTPVPPFLGPRFQRPAHYYIEDGESWLWDIIGAYAWSAAVCQYPELWEAEDKWSGNPLALVLATVVMPPKVPAIDQAGMLPEPRPIPFGAPFDLDYMAVRARRPYTAKVLLYGFELQSIASEIELGGVLQSWEPVGRIRALTNAAWREAVTEGRTLPGVAGRLAKRTGNALWGALSASGGFKRVNYRTGKYLDSGKLKARSLALASIICAQVRVRLWQEAFTTMPVIVGHTDSAIVPGGYSPSGVIGERLGDWRLKERMHHLQAFGLNTRRYKLASRRGAPWVYVNAAERGPQARRVFGAKLRRWLDPGASDPPIGEHGAAYHRWR